jgi:hypothetical protein
MASPDAFADPQRAQTTDITPGSMNVEMTDWTTR